MILDEPTSALTPGESDRLFEFLVDLSEHHDTAILYVSHRIGEIYALATRATVLRDGHKQGIRTPEVVPGDIALLESGNRVPADVRDD